MNADQILLEDLGEERQTFDFFDGAEDDNILDLEEIGIKRLGGFEQHGSLDGTWWLVATTLPDHYPDYMKNSPVIHLYPSPSYSVFVRGIFSKKLTNERRAAAGVDPL